MGAPRMPGQGRADIIYCLNLMSCISFYNTFIWTSLKKKKPTVNLIQWMHMFIVQYNSINIKMKRHWKEIIENLRMGECWRFYIEKKLLKIYGWGSVEDSVRHLWCRMLRKGSHASSIREDNCLRNSGRARGLSDKRGTEAVYLGQECWVHEVIDTTCTVGNPAGSGLLVLRCLGCAILP